MSDPTAHGRFAGAVSTNIAVPGVALAVGAHPDDIDFGCGGTLAKWAAAGCRVHYLVCTDGSKGTWDPAIDRDTLIADRRDEQQKASEVIGGGGRVTFLGRTDGELQADLDTRSLIAREIRAVRPDVLLAHDPWKRYRLHPDHRHAGFLATDGLAAARDPLFFPEQGLEPHRPGMLLLWEADEPDHIEDISGYEEVKMRALLCHRSQFRSTMKISEPDGGSERDAFAARMRARHAASGAAAGVAAAEAFKLITDI